ncbi:MAG: selenocysteine-specific translation elongation factor [marine benthic group bacterium]|nr:selenocysteine-specific translation elongation factor [Gemmatimonadota bacterium]
MPDSGSGSVIVGTAGHVDHGKSSLVRALTGIDPDRLVEEKRRGLTIELGFAPVSVDRGPRIELVDVPGHEDFMRTMLAGASGIDRLLLVVAADEGPMPQTLEHLDVAELLGIRRGVVALSKIDRVDADWQGLVLDAVREELQRFGSDSDWPILPISVLTGEGLEALREALIETASEVVERPKTDLFRLPIDRSFTIPGAGTVVTGSVWSGSVARGEAVQLLPSGGRARVRGIQRFGTDVETVGPASRCALSLAGLPLERVESGDMVVSDSGWRAVRRFGARIRLLPAAVEGLDHADRVRLYHGTSETLARVLLQDGGTLAPGESAAAVLVTRDPIPLRVRDRFVLRRVSPMRTIGGGRVAELAPTRRWRASATSWMRLLDAKPDEATEIAVRLAAGQGIDRSALALHTGFPVNPDEGPGNAVVLSDRLFATDIVDEAREAVLESIRNAHAGSPRQPGVPLESVRSMGADRYASPLLEEVLRVLESEGRVVREGPLVRIPDHRPRLTDAEEEAKIAVYGALAGGGLAPPSPARIEEAHGLDRALLHDLLRLLEREGRVVSLTPQLFLTTEQVECLREGAMRVLADSVPASPAAFGSEFNLSRREVIPLLEYLDRTGVTRRTGSGRVASDQPQE